MLQCGVLLLAVVGALLALRTLNLCPGTFRFGWISAVVVFGLWATVILSNQMYGKPPPTNWYFIAGFGLSCALSAFALALDPRPSAAA